MRLVFPLLLILGSAAAAEGPLDPTTIDTFKPYPLTTCIVSDEALGSMGEGISFVQGGQEFTLCCKSCLKKFAKDPAAFHAKLEQKKAQQMPDKGEKPADEAPQGHDAGHDHGTTH